MSSNQAFYQVRTFPEWEASRNKNKLHQRLQMVHQLGLDVLSGKEVALCLAGSPGIGKTYLIMRILHAAGIIKDLDDVKDDEFVTVRAKRWEDIVWALDKASKMGVPLVIEESDRILLNENMSEIFKLAGDKAGTRRTKMKVRIDYVEEYERSDGRIISHKNHRYEDQVVDLSAPIFITTNLDVRKVLDSAVVDRWVVPTLPRDRETIWEYVSALAVTKDLLKYRKVVQTKGGEIVRREDGKPIIVAKKVHHKHQNKALDLFTKNTWTLDVLSIRTLNHLLEEVVACADPKTHEIDEAKLEIGISRFMAEEPDPKLIGKPVPASPAIFFWQVVYGKQPDPNDFDANAPAAPSEDVEEMAREAASALGLEATLRGVDPERLAMHRAQTIAVCGEDRTPTPQEWDRMQAENNAWMIARLGKLLEDVLPLVDADVRKILLKLQDKGTNVEGLQAALSRNGIRAHYVTVGYLMQYLTAQRNALGAA